MDLSSAGSRATKSIPRASETLTSSSRRLGSRRQSCDAIPGTLRLSSSGTLTQWDEEEIESSDSDGDVDVNFYF